MQYFKPLDKWFIGMPLLSYYRQKNWKTKRRKTRRKLRIADEDSNDIGRLWDNKFGN